MKSAHMIRMSKKQQILGRTADGIEAAGAIVLIYTDSEPKKFIMGEETSYLIEKKPELVKKFRSNTGENIYNAFLSPGTIASPNDVERAKVKFTTVCNEIDSSLLGRLLGGVTFGNLKDSSTPGYISAKPRFVEDWRRKKYGFPKGSYETVDGTIEAGALREVREELGLILDPTRLINVRRLVKTGGTSSYAVFHYVVTAEEYATMTAAMELKSKSKENELRSFEFREISAKNNAKQEFFTNNASKTAYHETILGRVGGTRKTKSRSRRYKNRRTR